MAYNIYTLGVPRAWPLRLLPYSVDDLEGMEAWEHLWSGYGAGL